MRALLEKYGFAVAKVADGEALAQCVATARAGSSRLSSNTHKRKKLMEQNHNMLRGISENGGIVFTVLTLRKSSARWSACTRPVPSPPLPWAAC